MTLTEAKHLEVDVNAIGEYRFSQDKQWFAKFKPLVEIFYHQHLEWFYESTFDMEKARLKVEIMVSGLAAPRRSAALKRRNLLNE